MVKWWIAKGKQKGQRSIWSKIVREIKLENVDKSNAKRNTTNEQKRVEFFFQFLGEWDEFKLEKEDKWREKREWYTKEKEKLPNENVVVHRSSNALISAIANEINKNQKEEEEDEKEIRREEADEWS